ncbi:MAG: hypothetical protein KGH78_03665 [Candidatus Micrarchaeota archaeon]|nr:hypothetical protein [Candidatus Micrarchaeota archaeon]
MRTGLLALVAIIVIAAIALGAYLVANGLQKLATSTTTTSQGPTTTASSGATLFSSTRYASAAYQIFPSAPLSENGKIVTADFNVTSSQLPSGATMVSMVFSGSGARYNVTVNAGEMLYFIDMNLADDSPPHDGSSGDDGYAIVNQSGYTMQLAYPLNMT